MDVVSDRRTPTRLDLHRLSYLREKMKGPLLRVSDLEEEEKRTISDELLRRMKARRAPESEVHRVYMDVLKDWGIMCPHPQDMRLYEGSRRSEGAEDGSAWFTCEMCGCSVVNDVWVRDNAEELRSKSPLERGRARRGQEKARGVRAEPRGVLGPEGGDPPAA